MNSFLTGDLTSCSILLSANSLFHKKGLVMKSSSHTGLILVLVMLLMVLASLFWFLYSDWDEMRDQAALADSRATRVVSLEQDAGQLNDQLQTSNGKLEQERATAVFTQDMLEAEAVADQQTIQLLETRVATQTAVIEQNLSALTNTVPQVEIIAPQNGETRFLGEPVTLVVAASDANGITDINIVFDNNSPLTIPVGGDANTLIQEDWPVTTGEHTATITAVNSNNLSSQAISTTITVKERVSQEQIATEVANIIGLPEGETAVSAGDQLQTSGVPDPTAQILHAFDFEEQPDTDIVWGEFCAPLTPAADNDLQSPAGELAEVGRLAREWQETRYQFSQMLDAAPNQDARAALCALAAGHEQWVLNEYISRAPAERQAILQESLPPLPAEVPGDVLAAQQAFGLIYGPAFVDELEQTAGPTAVLDAWVTPPQTSAQILHLDTRQNTDPRPPIEMPALAEITGDGWTAVDDNVLGEFLLSQYLANYLHPVEAGIAAAGWDGDRYLLFSRDADEAPLLVMRIRWNSKTNGDNFARAYTDYLNGRFGEIGSTESLPDGSSCWSAPGDETICLYHKDRETAVVRAPDASLAADVFAEMLPLPVN